VKSTHPKLLNLNSRRINTYDDPISPPRKGYQQDALFAGNIVVPSSGESHGDQELSPVNKVQREPRDHRWVV